MKVLFFALFAYLFFPTFSSAITIVEDPIIKVLDRDEIVSTENLDSQELDILSKSYLLGDVISAQIHTVTNGTTFLEVIILDNGTEISQVTKGYATHLVPPCHCGPGADGIYNAWWEGKTPYQYQQAYCLPCLKQ